MNKRDLKADLELLEAGFHPSDIELVEIAKHAIERAIKAEALARELARELEEIKERGDWLERDCTEPDKVMIYAIDINVIGNGTLAKAKEVLGGEPSNGCRLI